MRCWGPCATACEQGLAKTLGKAPSLPGLDQGFSALLGAVRDRV